MNYQAPIGVGTLDISHNHFKSAASKRIEITRALTNALFAYLTFDSQMILDAEEPKPYRYPAPSPEDLVKQKAICEELEERITGLQEWLESGEIPEAANAIVKVEILAPLEQQLNSSREYLSIIQNAIEQSEQEAKS